MLFRSIRDKKEDIRVKEGLIASIQARIAAEVNRIIVDKQEKARLANLAKGAFCLVCCIV